LGRGSGGGDNLIFQKKRLIMSIDLFGDIESGCPDCGHKVKYALAHAGDSVNCSQCLIAISLNDIIGVIHEAGPTNQDREE
jgi:hypothetical protein